MKIFVAGATGVLGQPLVRALVAGGHEVTGLTRTPGRRALIEGLGARAAVADALDADDLLRVVRAAAPTHVVHLLTALPPAGVMRPRDLRATNHLRILGTANLLRAARAAGSSRIVAESFLAVYGAADFGEPRGEDEPLPTVGGGPMKDTIGALRSLEEQLLAARGTGLETVALRYGLLYGPDVPALAALGRLLRARKVFVPRGATGIASFVHVDDAVQATVAALEHPAPAPTYNVVDDQPMALADYLSLAAAAFAAPPPRTMPAWIFQLAAPVMAHAAFTRLPLSNAKARRELGWTPAHPTLAEGLPAVAAAMRVAA